MPARDNSMHKRDTAFTARLELRETSATGL